MNVNLLRWGAVLPLALLTLCVQAEPGTLVRDTQLRAKPFIDATVLETLPGEASVEILLNQGGWTQVRSAAGHTGWVRLLNVRAVSAQSGEGLVSGLATLGNVARTGSSGATATTGTKGVTRDRLERAAPDLAEVRRMERYRVSLGAAQAHARDLRLAPQSVAFLSPDDEPSATDKAQAE
ncbi:MAG: SH3 domain-containing protein [Pseudomonadota bacterium]